MKSIKSSDYKIEDLKIEVLEAVRTLQRMECPSAQGLLKKYGFDLESEIVKKVVDAYKEYENAIGNQQAG